MSLSINILNGDNFADINANKSAERIGERIRTIREAREMTRAELGSLVGLDQSRIQQYENGRRKPKLPLLKKLAVALGVEAVALMDPATDSYIGIMHALFQMEEEFKLKVVKNDGCLCLMFDDGRTGSINSCLRKWYEIRQELEESLPILSDEEQRKKVFDYNMFEWTYPSGISIGNGKKYDEHPINRIQELKESSERLKDIMKEIDNESNKDDN